MVTQLQQCIENQDADDAKRVLHTLKGIARTMGANELGNIAEREEMHIRESGQASSNDFATATLLPVLLRACSAIEEFAAHLGDMPAFPQQASAAENRRDLPIILAELVGLLKSRNMRTLTVFAELKALYGDALGDRLPPIEQAINNLDFAQARQAAISLQEGWQ